MMNKNDVIQLFALKKRYRVYQSAMAPLETLKEIKRKKLVQHFELQL